MTKFGPTEKLIIYILSKKNWMATKEIVELLGKIKISESAVRTSLFRLRNKKIANDSQKGRETLFSLSDSGKEFVGGYWDRLSRSEKKWDGKWLLFSFNIPEKKRKLRNVLRQELISLGFGRFHSNLWISPYDIRKECNKIIEQLNIREYTIMFVTNSIGDDPKLLTFRIWNLEKLSITYQKLGEKYKKQYEEFRKFEPADSSQWALEALVRYLKLKEEALEFGVKEPFLPKELLPNNWIVFELKELFYKYLQFLYQKMSPLVGFDYMTGKK